MYTKIPEFNFYCQKVLPLVYDQSLSYYETLCKMKVYLNDTINSQNMLLDGFKELLNWINDQLENYTKSQLEKWLDDGTLEQIINDTIFKDLSAKVEKNKTDITLLKDFLNYMPIDGGIIDGNNPPNNPIIDGGVFDINKLKIARIRRK